tara:strand:- start:4558 stop:5007 length:450 start_codon:yes stop_codon:yes gene_type:complete
MPRTKDKERREKIRDLLSQHLPWKAIHSLTGASDTLILSVRDDMVRDGFDEDRELSIKLGRISTLALEKLEGQILSGDVKPRDLSVVSAVSLDKRLLLSGRATSRVEHVRSDTAALREELANVIDVSTIPATTSAPESPKKLPIPAKSA